MANICAMMIACTGLTLSGCTESADTPEPAAATQSAGDAEATVEIPAGVFASTAPSNAVPLAAAKTSVRAGDDVVFEARVGGRVNPFIEDRAMFFVVDSEVKSCDQLHGDACKTPWDYCCEPRDSLRANMATIQVVDERGRPLRTAIQGVHGLEPLKTVLVEGVVDQIDPAGNFVVNARAIHVKQ